ncbi:MAG TPA: OsmC family protein [Bryobacteraceae bacterium]|jgi:organic hydroperoxide reductase OsmC/OhrA|nr:OsmC family protein [Bryobacteraceae bacterium]
MPHKEHHYRVQTIWTGNTGAGTATYRSYERAHEIRSDGKPLIPGSSDPAFRGDASRWNPEEFVVSALSTCHMLSYLHLCALGGIVVTQYSDEAEGFLEETKDGGGHLSRALLRPVVTITSESDIERAKSLHHNAHEKCFIANSVNFPVECEPTVKV